MTEFHLFDVVSAPPRNLHLRYLHGKTGAVADTAEEEESEGGGRVPPGGVDDRELPRRRPENKCDGGGQTVQCAGSSAGSAAAPAARGNDAGPAARTETSAPTDEKLFFFSF